MAKNILIVGSGWRAFFYYRVIKALPEKFNLVAMLTRTKEKAERLSKEYGINVTTNKEACIEAKPELVVVATSKTNIVDTAMEWADLGFQVLMETPAGVNEQDFEKLTHFQNKDRIQVAEQYHRYPRFQAMKKLLDENILGDLIDMNLSFCHDYHGVSLIRFFMGDLSKAKVLSSVSYPLTMLETGARAGVTYTGQLKEYKRSITVLEIEKNRHVTYDFSGVQYHTEIKSSRVNIQGSLGEMMDDRFSYAVKTKDENVVAAVACEKSGAGKLAYGVAAGLSGFLTNMEDESGALKANPDMKFSLSSSVSSAAIGYSDLEDYSEAGKESYEYKSGKLEYNYDSKRDLKSISFMGRELWTNDYLSCGFTNDEIGIADFLSGKASYSLDWAVEDARLANTFS